MNMNIFDIIGPVMIGPSSSHTAGAVRIGYVARLFLGTPICRAHILLHGSFAKTYKGHGTDKALVAGIMGMLPSDSRIRESLNLAERAGLKIEFEKGDIEGAHPNTTEITLWDNQERCVCVRGSSVGGGKIIITNLNEIEVSIRFDYATFIILHDDRPGMIAGVANILSSAGINISNFHVSRKKRGGEAVMSIEVDQTVPNQLRKSISSIPGIISVTFLDVL